MSTEQKKIEIPALDVTDLEKWEATRVWDAWSAQLELSQRMCRERQLIAALTRIEELTEAINDIIRHQVLVGGSMAENSATVRIARAALLPSPPAEGDQG